MTETVGWILERVVSGGQTGVDRGALDAAIAAGIPHGGWCPKGRLAEDGVIPVGYQLRETDSAEYRFRTEQNVLDSDGTLIIFQRRLWGGTLLTRRLAQRHRKPCLLIDLADRIEFPAVADWLRNRRIRVLNVAGPRESSLPGAAREARRVLVGVFAHCRD